MNDQDKTEPDQPLPVAGETTAASPSPRAVTITGAANVGTQADSSRATGVNIEHLEAGEVHIHSDNAPADQHPARTAVITGMIAFLAAVSTNIATNMLPDSWRPYLWLAWPIAVLVTVAGIAVAVRTPRGDAAPARRATWRPEDRATMLANVRRIWIDGVLKQSLWNKALLTLRLSEQPDAVIRPYGLHLDGAPLPMGMTIQNVYDAQQGALLILGQPGSGKTTLLLELARTLLDRADSKATHPIPVVFNLASWEEKQTLIDWLVGQLNREYVVPKKIGQAWVDAGVVLPLLDGLDEVAETRRAACVGAINAYRSQHEVAWATPIVVSCRTREYESLPDLQLNGAIQVQPLTRTEIDSYLRDGGRPLAGVRAVVKDDPTLYPLLETPLLLAVTTLAFAGQNGSTLRQAVSLDERRRVIFAAFVERQLQPPPDGRSTAPRYDRSRILRWLTWIAKRMQERNQTVFWIENLQPDWLSPELRWVYPVIVLSILILGVSILLMPADNNVWASWALGAILASILKGRYPVEPGKRWTWAMRWFWGISVGLCVFILMVLYLLDQSLIFPILIILGVVGTFTCFCTALLAPYVDHLAARIIRTMKDTSGHALNTALIVGIGVFTGLGVPLAIADPKDLPKAIVAGINIGVSVSLFIKPLHTIQMIEKLQWHWRPGFFVGLCSGVLMGLSVWSFTDGLRVMVLFGLLAGISGRETIDTRLKPNQGVRRSAMNALTGVAIGTIVWLVFEVGFVLGLPPSVMNYDTAMQAGLIAALIWALRGGLIACVQHAVLRALLVIMGMTPLFLVRMLDDTSSRILIRKTGGGYMFHHLLLQDYFVDRGSYNKSK